MISLLKGQLVETGNKYIVLDVGGVGYKVYMTESALHSLNIGEEIRIWTYLAVRDDSMDLYGFLKPNEKSFFELLITVSGIGPKGALNILSSVTVDTLTSAIRSGSVGHLVKISGIGKKTAEKIVIELKDKLINISDGSQISSELSSDIDAIEALCALGYNVDEAREALKTIDPGITDTGKKVKFALKHLGK